MDKDSLIYVAGHRGLVGSALCRALERTGYNNLLTRSHAELDLCDQAAVKAFFAQHKPDIVVLAAAKVGGIHANATYPAEFICQNLQIQNNVIDSAHRNGCKKLLFLGSSCIYPKMCQAYRKQYGFDAISAMPTNLYGPGDNYHPENSHVIPTLIRRFHEAKMAGAEKVTIWGTGKALREFLYVDDMAEACVFLLENYSDFEHVNVGSGSDISIIGTAQRIARAVGFEGRIDTDPTRPDGTPRKLMDCSKLFNMGWQPRVGLEDGLAASYQWFCHAGGQA